MTTVDRPTETQLYKRRLAIFIFFVSCLPSWRKGGNVNTALLTAAAAFALCFVYKMAVDAPVGRSTGTEFDGIGSGRCYSCFLGVACVGFGS